MSGGLVVRLPFDPCVELVPVDAGACIASMFVGRVRQCFSQPKKNSDETRNIDLTKYKRRRHEERTRPAAPHSLQHRSVSSVGSQPISHTPAHEPDVTWRCETGFNPSLSRPSSTRPSNALDLEPSCAVFFAFSITHRIKTHGPYTPKCEGPVMTQERL